MLTHRSITILGLALCLAGARATTPALARPVSTTPAAPAMTVVGHPVSHWLALHITGQHFVPGTRVGIAVVDAARWHVLARRVTYAQPKDTQVICGHDFQVCRQPNPRAGTIDDRVRLSSAPATSNLLVLYRTGSNAGMQSVSLR